MIVDDEDFNVMVVRQHLRNAGYSRFVCTSESTEALELIRNEQPDIVLLDIVMPRISGSEILHAMRLDPNLQHIPVLVLTASTDAQVRKTCLDLGATDFLVKPVDPIDLVPRVRNTLLNKANQDRMANYAEELESEVKSRTLELAASREEVVHCLARAGEYRDDETGHHVVRVGRYVGIIARELASTILGLKCWNWPRSFTIWEKSASRTTSSANRESSTTTNSTSSKNTFQFGKHILQPMPPEEAQRLQSHVRLGASMLHVPSSPLLMLAAKIAQTHHEDWDGNGYPLGLSGEDIPLEGRMTAVADVYDALSSARPLQERLLARKVLCHHGRNAGHPL